MRLPNPNPELGQAGARHCAGLDLAAVQKFFEALRGAPNSDSARSTQANSPNRSSALRFIRSGQLLFDQPTDRGLCLHRRSGGWQIVADVGGFLPKAATRLMARWPLVFVVACAYGCAALGRAAGDNAAGTFPAGANAQPYFEDVSDRLNAVHQKL